MPGWVALYSDDDTPEIFHAHPVAAWAVMQDEEGDTWITGIDPTGSGYDGRTCEEVGNSSEYAFQPDPTREPQS